MTSTFLKIHYIPQYNHIWQKNLMPMKQDTTMQGGKMYMLTSLFCNTKSASRDGG